MDVQDRFREILASGLLEAQNRNKAYSMRSHAQKLGVSPSSLSEFLAGKRPLGKKILQRLVNKIDVSEILRKELSNAILKEFEKNRLKNRSWKISKDNLVLIGDEDSHIYRDWQYFAIMSLSNTSDYVGRADFVARRLGLEEQEAEFYMKELLRLDLLKRNYKNEYISSGKELRSRDGVPSSDIREHHRQNLDLAKQSLENDSVENRDFTFLCMGYSPKDLPRMKEWIKKFRRDFLNEFETKDRTEIGRLCIQLFSVSKETGNTND